MSKKLAQMCMSHNKSIAATRERCLIFLNAEGRFAGAYEAAAEDDFSTFIKDAQEANLKIIDLYSNESIILNLQTAQELR